MFLCFRIFAHPTQMHSVDTMWEDAGVLKRRESERRKRKNATRTLIFAYFWDTNKKDANAQDANYLS